jgi:3',5'-cyclic-AMP phosphodiesterase
MSPLSILQITDLHILPGVGETFLGINTEHYFHATLELAFANHQHFDLILLTGDLAQEPSSAGYQRILNRLEATNTSCICLPGNHDDYAIMEQVFNTGLINCRKQVLWENWQLICLNSVIPGSPGGRLSDQELAFLEECLTGNPNHHALIAVHHHCLETGSAWMDTMMIENSQAFWAIIKQYPQTKTITTGHIHQVMDFKIGSVRVLGTPSTCFQFTPFSKTFSLDKTPPGYRLIRLYADGNIESNIIRLSQPINELQLDTQNY